MIIGGVRFAMKFARRPSACAASSILAMSPALSFSPRSMTTTAPAAVHAARSARLRWIAKSRVTMTQPRDAIGGIQASSAASGAK